MFNWSLFAAVSIIVFVTHYAGSIAAFGSTLLALPLLVWVITDIQTAVLVLLLVGTVQTYQIALYTVRDIRWRSFGWMLLWAALGLPIGFLSVEILPERVLLGVLAGALIGSGILRMVRSSTVKRFPEPFLIGLLVAGGVIHGAFATGGALIVVYAGLRFTDKKVFRAHLNFFWVVANTGLIVVTLLRRGLGEVDLPVVAAAIPVVVFASYLGNRTAVRLSQDSFATVVSVLLIFAGIVTLLRAFRG